MTSCTSGLPRLRTAFTHRLDVPSKVYLERSGFHPAEAIVASRFSRRSQDRVWRLAV